MNKRLAKLMALLPILGLVACADTAELYPGDAYIGGDFMNNHYSIWSDGLKEAPVSKSVTIENERHGYFNGKANKSDPLIPSDFYGLGQAAEWHPEDFTNDKNQVYSWDPDILGNAGIGQWEDQTPLVGVAYGQTKKLSLISPKFSRGYLSKLYNGQVRCNAWSSYSVVEIDKTGYGTVFPAELLSGKSFSMALRGGSDTPSVGRVSTFDIHVTFYKLDERNSYVGTTINLNDVKLQTNQSAEITSLVGFYFEDVGLSPEGIVGMSVTYDLVEDVYSKDGVDYHPSDDFSDDNQYHIALMMLEVFFPDSSWN